MDYEYFLPNLLVASASDDFSSGVSGDSEVIMESVSTSALPLYGEAVEDETFNIENFISVEAVQELASNYAVQGVGLGFALASILVLVTFGVFKAFSLLHIKF